MYHHIAAIEKLVTRQVCWSIIVVPNLEADKLELYANATPVEILVNTPSIQGVFHNRLNIGGFVFYKAGSIQFKKMLITVDSACTVLIKHKDNSVSISMSDPTQKLQTINLTISLSEANSETNQLDNKKTIQFKMPQGDHAGSTVTKVLQLTD